MQPYSLTDNVDQEAVTSVIGSNDACFHETILTYLLSLLPS